MRVNNRHLCMMFLSFFVEETNHVSSFSVKPFSNENNDNMPPLTEYVSLSCGNGRMMCLSSGVKRCYLCNPLPHSYAHGSSRSDIHMT
mmetsp:Transcript_17875/g.25889  ORF Transcript_17875/g.25889 Transcript_17875/m.25889 type:complete len:88 (-) Transcript_17875:13-276(-)